MEWIGFAGSVLGGLIGGLFTYFGVRITLKHEREKERKEELEKINETKPRLDIENFLDFEETKELREENDGCNVLVLKIEEFKKDKGRSFFDYDKKALEEKNLKFVEYELKNIGMTEIETIYVTSNLPKNLAPIELELREKYIELRMLNCIVQSNQAFIKPGDAFKLRVYYLKTFLSSIGFPTLTLWLADTNGRYWSQLLSSPYKEIDMPRLRPYSDFSESKNLRLAIERFTDPNK